MVSGGPMVVAAVIACYIDDIGAILYFTSAKKKNQSPGRGWILPTDPWWL